MFASVWIGATQSPHRDWKELLPHLTIPPVIPLLLMGNAAWLLLFGVARFEVREHGLTLGPGKFYVWSRIKRWHWDTSGRALLHVYTDRQVVHVSIPRQFHKNVDQILASISGANKDDAANEEAV